MTNEQAFLLNILSDHLMGRKTSRREDIDWKELYNVSYRHQLVSIVYYQCKDFIEGEYFDYYQKSYYKIVTNSVQREKYFKPVSEALTEEGIEFITVKGMNIAKYYPVPELRTMGDIDIIMKDEDRPRAQEVILSKGFEPAEKIVNGEWKYKKQDVEIELHSNIVYKAGNVNREELYIDYFNNYREHMVGGNISHEFNFLVALRHLRKHLVTRGVGIRQFFDIAVLCKNDTEIDFDKVKASVKELGLVDFANRVFAFCEHWFGLKPPYDIGEIDETFYDDTIDLIFSNGVFGFDNADNEKATDINKLLLSDKEDRGSEKIHSAINWLFPPYSVMKEKYKILERAPFLLPFAWIYKFISAIFGGRAKLGAKHVKNSLVSDELIEKREEMYKKWGI